MPHEEQDGNDHMDSDEEEEEFYDSETNLLQVDEYDDFYDCHDSLQINPSIEQQNSTVSPFEGGSTLFQRT